MTITVDDREAPSGVVDLLDKNRWEVSVRRLAVGDYRIGGEALIERKSACDFVLSIVDGRLFRQASQLKKQGLRTAIVVEGSPYETQVDIHPESVRGAIVSVSMMWQVPILFSASLVQTFEMFGTMAAQLHRFVDLPLARTGFRPKRLMRRQLHILQGFPGIGPLRSIRLLKYFKSLRIIFEAKPEQWMAVEGIGKTGARQVAELLDAEFDKERKMG